MAVTKCHGSVPVMLFGVIPALLECGEPAEALVRGACACGHDRGGWACSRHLGELDNSGCVACLLLPDGAHDCSVTLTVTRRPGLS